MEFPPPPREREGGVRSREHASDLSTLIVVSSVLRCPYYGFSFYAFRRSTVISELDFFLPHIQAKYLFIKNTLYNLLFLC